MTVLEALADSIESAADRLEARPFARLSPEIVWQDEASVSWEWILADRAKVTSLPFAVGG